MNLTHLYDSIVKCLMSHHMQSWYEIDDKSTKSLLIDMLTPKGESITVGESEIHSIADEICNVIEDLIRDYLLIDRESELRNLAWYHDQVRKEINLYDKRRI